MAVSFNDLYNAKLSLIGGGLVDPGVGRTLRENAYAGALADYEKLTGGGGTPTTAAPTTLRSVTAPLPKPTMSTGSIGIGGGKGMGTASIAGAVAPTLTLPEYDMGKVEQIAQRVAAPGIRNLRGAVQAVQQGYYENPNVKRMTVRDALAGYGQGLEDVSAGAFKTGAGIYGTEYAAGLTKATAEFGAGEARALQGTSIASQEKMQANSLAAQQAMQASSIASNEKLSQYNNEWRAYLASL